LAKSGWSIAGGGALMLYSVFGQRVFPVGKDAAVGIGLLYGSRGVGALLGPYFARRFGGDGERWLQRAIGLSFTTMAVAYLGFAWSPVLALAALFLLVVHMGVSTIWTFSNALINL